MDSGLLTDFPQRDDLASFLAPSEAENLGTLPGKTIPVVQARTEIPRFARDDK